MKRAGAAARAVDAAGGSSGTAPQSSSSVPDGKKPLTPGGDTMEHSIGPYARWLPWIVLIVSLATRFYRLTDPPGVGAFAAALLRCRVLRRLACSSFFVASAARCGARSAGASSQ